MSAERTIHYATHVREDGGVKAVCAVSRPINLKKATWSLFRSAVTCKKCLKILEGWK